MPTYVSIVIPVRQPQPSAMYQLADDNCPDYSKPAKDALDATGLKWTHSYYWPGDDYYAYVKIERDETMTLQRLRQLGEVQLIDEHYLTHRGKTVGEEFKSEGK